MAQGRKFAARPHRTGDPARLGFGGVVGRYPLGKTRSQHVHVVRLVGDAVFVEIDGGAVEGIGLDNVATDVEKAGVYFFNCVGTRYEQVLVATFKAQTAEIVEASGSAPEGWCPSRRRKR